MASDDFIRLLDELDRITDEPLKEKRNQRVVENPAEMYKNETKRYFIDFVFCIDASNGMDYLLERIKTILSELFSKCESHLLESNFPLICELACLRVKIIAFRDIFSDGDQWLTLSGFFNLPAQEKDLLDFLQTLKAKGGGKHAQSALEALALAINSDWIEVDNPGFNKSRHIILLFTDEPSHAFEEAEYLNPEHYPSEMPKNYHQLVNDWNSYAKMQSMNDWLSMIAENRFNKRIIAFVPEDSHPWDWMTEELERCCVIPIERGSKFRSAEIENIFYNFGLGVVTGE